jgi:hypothetical protein
LDTPLNPFSPDFIKEQGKYHRDYDPQDYLAPCNPYGIPQGPWKFHHVEEKDEIFQTHPLGTHDPQGGKVILKSHHQSPNRDIMIDKNQNYRGKQHKVQNSGIVFPSYGDAFLDFFRFHMFFLSI